MGVWNSVDSGGISDYMIVVSDSDVNYKVTPNQLVLNHSTRTDLKFLVYRDGIQYSTTPNDFFHNSFGVDSDYVLIERYDSNLSSNTLYSANKLVTYFDYNILLTQNNNQRLITQTGNRIIFPT